MKSDNKTGRIKMTRWFIYLFIGWGVAVLFYLFIVAKESEHGRQ